ncbi:conserved hypothetical protein [Clostridiaceae bacterium BL-3]|nr:conserved hypothetical protein [Clostridiaceae bacterium BL-3]
MYNFINNLNTNTYFIFLVSISGIFGFTLSIYVTHKSSSIAKTLNHILAAQNYNESRTQFVARFRGYKDSILKDNLKSRQIIHDILEDIFKFETQYKILLAQKDLIKLFFIKLYLKKNFNKINFNKICIYLDFLIGRCYKKEEGINDFCRKNN